MDTKILSHQQIQHKVSRIAYQIYENNINEKEIIIAGIAPNGHILAEKIASYLREISPIKVTLCTLELDENNYLKAQLSIDIKNIENRSLVLVDDVLNTGRHLIYGVRYFLEIPLKYFKTAVLVNRNHKKYPVKADFKGISLSTSLKEHIRVVLNENSKQEDAVYLE